MKRLSYFLALVLILFSSCAKDDGTVVTGKKKFTIAIENSVPATVYPGEELEFVFSVKFADGIRTVRATADGKTIEGSEKEFDNCPDSVGVSFKYKAQDAYAGNSIDFAVIAQGVDGTMGHYDIPVFILAAKPDINFEISDDAPEEFLVDGSEVSFTVTITSGSIDMKKLTTYKNDVAMPSMSYDLEGDLKKTVLPFRYTPTLGDTGLPTVFTFEIMDVNGNFVSENYTIHFYKQASTELNEYTALNMGLNKCTAFGQFLDAMTGTVYVANGVGAHCADIDLAIFWSGNSSTIGVAFASPNASNVTSIYPEATIVTTLGGTIDDVPANWAVRNETNFREIEIDADQFAGISTCAEVEELFENGVAPTNDHVTFKKVAGSTVAFKINRLDENLDVTSKYGVIRVTARPATNNTGNITIDYKIEK